MIVFISISFSYGRALENADSSAAAIDYVSAYGTVTELGNITETQATAAVYGKNIAISSMKSYTGHTLWRLW